MAALNLLKLLRDTVAFSKAFFNFKSLTRWTGRDLGNVEWMPMLPPQARSNWTKMGKSTVIVKAQKGT